MFRFLLFFHILCFSISHNKKIIEKDFENRKRYRFYRSKSIIGQLCEALWYEPEYRNQFYYRLEGKWSKRFLNVLLPSLRNIDLGDCYIDEVLVLIHGYNVVINPLVRIGKNCTILHEVTIGAIKDGVPRLGDNIYIGCGAKILGGVQIGNNAKIGACAVVLSDVPENATAVGFPARIIKPINC